MSVWYDPEAGKYRSSLPYKVFYVWGWKPTRWVMFRCMPSETAHHFGMRGIWIVGRIDTVWFWITLLPKLVWKLISAMRYRLCTPPPRMV